jgi:hypothetical protein
MLGKVLGNLSCEYSRVGNFQAFSRSLQLWYKVNKIKKFFFLKNIFFLKATSDEKKIRELKNQCWEFIKIPEKILHLTSSISEAQILFTLSRVKKNKE